MARAEHPMQALSAFLPDGSFEQVVAYIQHYRVHLTITKKRKSVLGDYRHPVMGKNHRITVNGDLNKYEFLLTLLHELAHLLTFEQYRNRVEAHGAEWKACYSNLLIQFVEKGIFPDDIKAALHRCIMNPAATANGETDLLLVLRKYNTRQNGLIPVADIPAGRLFQTENGRVFMKGLLRRKRFECVEVKSGLRYSFSAVTEVRLLDILPT
ncbi:SprT-like domain-containing protein [Sediminibacterium goheungense]|uniref:SprT-like family protein n=1 Tax=Sediminibacterium goheungense TaxID=1086393 RepID=A0A4R6J0K9_9BACT|nr:SprT-like domain-containing protein [Sediminibacterium goheungense]TDO28337.1 SprT-like family protein [Sediminibacterium goheungense]